VRVLAVLELYKQGLVDLDQPSSFAELTVTWTGPATAELAAVDVYEG
jgi:segregation and condensation protein A